MKKTQTNWQQYVEQTSRLLGLSINLEYLPGVLANLEKLDEIASLVVEFDLPEDTIADRESR